MKDLRRFLVCLLALIWGVGTAWAMEIVRDFDVSVSLRADDSMMVTETILIDVDNTTIKHGFVRIFPANYRDRDGKMYDVPFDVVSAVIDGRKTKTSLNWRGANVEIAIGNPDDIIRPGLHTFVFTYTTGEFVGFFKDHDELYWNVTGKDWQWTIEKASFRLSLPGKKPGEGFLPGKIEWYAGPYGSKESYMKGATLQPDNSVRSTAALPPGNVLTVVYSWPKGLITPVDPDKDKAAQTTTGIVTLIASFVSCLLVWFVWGRNPAKKTVIPLFNPPYGASPAALRYAWKLNLDSTSFASNVVDMLARGALRFFKRNKPSRPENKQRVLSKTGAGRKLSKDEDLMLEKFYDEIVFDERDKCTSGGASLSDASDEMWQFVSSGNPWPADSALQRPSQRNKMLASLIPLVIGLVAMFFVMGSSALNLTFSAIFSITSLVCGWLLQQKNSQRSRPAVVIWGLVPAAVCALLMVGVGMIERSICLPAVLSFIISAALPVAVMPMMDEKRTLFGMDLLSQVEGFRMYLNTAEKNQLEALNPPQDTPELFQRYLPYALALDAAETWANRFRDVLEGAVMNDFASEWYSGDMGAFVYTVKNIWEMQSSHRDTSFGSSTPSSPTSGSGSGGGGFAGGGGGGGGGRGW